VEKHLCASPYYFGGITMDNRLKEIAENIEKYTIGLDEPFKFKCRGCGKCCKNRDDVMLTSRDLFVIAKHLGKSPADVIEEYGDCFIGQDSRFPIIRIQPRGVNRACPFLVGKRCQIHESKPVVCALFPVGRVLVIKEIPREGEEPEYIPGYILQPTECGSLSKTNTVRQWLEKFGIPVDDEFYLEWNAALMRISTTMRKLEETIPAKALLPLQNVLVELIYVRYDTGEEFLPQFIKNAETAKKLVDDMKNNLAPFLVESGGEDDDGE